MLVDKYCKDCYSEIGRNLGEDKFFQYLSNKAMIGERSVVVKSL